ncbi:TPA: hypothetical protein ACJJJZ_001338, partial [Neisseria meningitidis]
GDEAADSTNSTARRGNAVLVFVNPLYFVIKIRTLISWRLNQTFRVQITFYDFRQHFDRRQPISAIPKT